MASRNMSYDHPAYVAVLPITATLTAGANTNGGRFAAFTSMIAKAAQYTVITAGTTASSAAGYIAYKVSGTTTTAISTVTLSTNITGVTTNIGLSTTTLAAGDMLMSRSGADATIVAQVTYELQIAPGANVTV